MQKFESVMDIKKRKAIFLDRDGVINIPLIREGKSFAPRTVRDFKFYPDMSAILKNLKSLDFLLIIVTNQPDIGNGLVDIRVVEAMHKTINQQLPIDHIEMCPHSQKDECECRKPKPGMLLQSALRFNINLRESIMIGDRWSDIEAGQKAGCKSIFIDRHYHEQRPNGSYLTVESLQEAAYYLLKE